MDKEEILDRVFELDASLGREVEKAFEAEYKRGRLELAEYLSNLSRIWTET